MKSLIEALDDLHAAAANFRRAVAEAALADFRNVRAGDVRTIARLAAIIAALAALAWVLEK